MEEVQVKECNKYNGMEEVQVKVRASFYFVLEII